MCISERFQDLTYFEVEGCSTAREVHPCTCVAAQYLPPMDEHNIRFKWRPAILEFFKFLYSLNIKYLLVTFLFRSMGIYTMDAKKVLKLFCFFFSLKMLQMHSLKIYLDEISDQFHNNYSAFFHDLTKHLEKH